MRSIAARALREALVDLRYLPFLWLVAAAVADARGRRITFGGLAIIVGAWTVDALVQAVTGTSPLFFGMDSASSAISGHGMCTDEAVQTVDRLSGILGPCNLKFGQMLASLSPFVLYAAARRLGVLGWWIAATLVGIVVLLAGARAAWVIVGARAGVVGLAPARLEAPARGVRRRRGRARGARGGRAAGRASASNARRTC